MSRAAGIEGVDRSLEIRGCFLERRSWRVEKAGEGVGGVGQESQRNGGRRQPRG
jgi:hypothetical protein